MIDPWLHEIGRQRHRDLLARAERDRLRRVVRDRNRTDRLRLWLTSLLGWAFAVSRFRAGAPGR